VIVASAGSVATATSPRARDRLAIRELGRPGCPGHGVSTTARTSSRSARAASSVISVWLIVRARGRRRPRPGQASSLASRRTSQPLASGTRIRRCLPRSAPRHEPRALSRRRRSREVEFDAAQPGREMRRDGILEACRCHVGGRAAGDRRQQFVVVNAGELITPSERARADPGCDRLARAHRYAIGCQPRGDRSADGSSCRHRCRCR